ncbi:MAG: ribonuclease III [Bacteroidales bacterium]
MSRPVFKRSDKLSAEDKSIILFIKNIFGFRPGNIFLYRQALRHKSAASTVKEGVKDSNERLEFLGDAVLSTIIADYLFQKFPFKEEGFLTETRSKIVSRVSLNRLAQRLGIGSYLSTSPELLKNPSNTILGDAMEALIGAIYLDKGFNFTKQTIIRYLLDIYMNINEVIDKEVNFKSRIIEWGQHHRQEVEFRVAEEIQSRHHPKQYRVEVYVDKKVVGSSLDFSIKGAEQLAAEKGLAFLEGEQ